MTRLDSTRWFLETSLQEIVLHGEAFAVAFYERLFTRFPDTRAFFANTDMFEQRKKLQESLALIVQHIQQPEALSRMLQELGQRHVTYGVRPEHYPSSETSCWRPSRTCLRPHWTEAHHDAWGTGYAAVSRLMLQGAERPPGT